MTPYQEFNKRLSLLIAKNPNLITTTLSNIFTMRLIGNKTHGDLAEIAIAEFINQYMYDFKCEHVGKLKFRSKSSEEDIQITNEITNQLIPVSLKAFGHGALQLSTDKHSSLFNSLEKNSSATGAINVQALWEDPAFSNFGDVNILPLIYDEPHKKCNSFIFDSIKAKASIVKVTRLDPVTNSTIHLILTPEDGDQIITELAKSGVNKLRKHPVYRFYDKDEVCVCEVRYGGATANPLQRGLWTNTKSAANYFLSITNGWVDYSESSTLVELFSYALLSTDAGHSAALRLLKQDVELQKQNSTLA